MIIVAMATISGLIVGALAGPERQIGLVCTGTQVTYRSDAPARSSLPWSRTYTISLKAKTYCESRCRPDAYVDAVNGDRLVFGDAEYGPQSTRLTYTAANNAIYGDQVVSFGGAGSLHVETRGTCTLDLSGAPPSSSRP